MANSTDKLLTKGSRRGFLKTAGAIGGLSALPNVVAAQETLSHQDVFQGTKSVVDLKITHPDADPGISRGSGSGGPRTNYIYDGDLYLIKSPVSEVQNTDSGLLRSPKDITSFTENTYFEQSELYETFDYGSTTENLHLTPETKYPPFELKVRISNGKATVSQDSDTLLSVDSGDQRSTTLVQRELGLPVFGEPEEITISQNGVKRSVTTRPKVGTRSVTVSPELTLRYHGKTGIYGVENGVVVPENSDEIRSLVEGKSTSTALVIQDVEDDSVVVIKRNNTGEN